MRGACVSSSVVVDEDLRDAMALARAGGGCRTL
jgi:hypothetical protein